MSTDSNHAESAGRAVGRFARRVKDAADQGKWIEKVLILVDGGPGLS